MQFLILVNETSKCFQGLLIAYVKILFEGDTLTTNSASVSQLSGYDLISHVGLSIGKICSGLANLGTYLYDSCEFIIGN